MFKCDLGLCIYELSMYSSSTVISMICRRQVFRSSGSVYVPSPALSAILLSARPKRYSTVNDVSRRLTARSAASGWAPSRYDDPAEVVDASYYSCCFHILPPFDMMQQYYLRESEDYYRDQKVFEYSHFFRG